MSTELMQTPLFDLHKSSGAKIVPFAGYEMPVSYAGIKVEHNAVREKVGVFDVSHMGNFEVRGPGAQSFLESMTSNGVHKLEVGDVQYSSLCAEDGGMIDDILVYRYDTERYQVIVNAANKALDWNEFSQALPELGVEMVNQSSHLGIVALQGPLAVDLAAQILGEELRDMKFYSCGIVQYQGQELLMSRTGYTGEDGFEFYLNQDCIVPFWKELLVQGEAFGLELCGLGCRDTLRLEAGYSLYGHELTRDVTPLESGLAWICDLETEFRGKAAMMERRAQEGATTIIGLQLIDKGIPREGYSVQSGDSIIGVVTSGSISPLSGNAIAMARVTKGSVKIGDEVEVIIRDKPKKASVVSRRFYTRD